MIDVFVRLVPLPTHVEGLTVPNNDETYSVYINSLLCDRMQHSALRHELQHIKKITSTTTAPYEWLRQRLDDWQVNELYYCTAPCNIQIRIVKPSRHGYHPCPLAPIFKPLTRFAADERTVYYHSFRLGSYSLHLFSKLYLLLIALFSQLPENTSGIYMEEQVISCVKRNDKILLC